MLARNSRDGEFILYASGPYSYIDTVLVPRNIVEPPNVEDLLHWNGCNPFSPRSAYVFGGGREGTWIEHGHTGTGTKSLEGCQNIVFLRTFDGWSGPESTYFEVLQEFLHLANIHWLAQQSAYCRLDKNGDLDPVLSTTHGGSRNGITIATIEREILDEYLSITDQAIIQLFDFTLLRRGRFQGWRNGTEHVGGNDCGMWFRQHCETGVAAYTRGIQVIQPRDSYAPREPAWLVPENEANKSFVSFEIYDWRNARVTRVSTDPKETTNYFEAHNNDLPFEVSPAFFRPEVLLKYKADKDKYRIETRSVSCRGAWSLTGIDINEAGQVHAYICDLGKLPYSEQLHWASHNEAPKASISERAYICDIKGEFTNIVDPIDKLKTMLTRWADAKLDWWSVVNSASIYCLCTPVTTSRDEWAEAFLDLNKLINEGFVLRSIRRRLDDAKVAYGTDEKSLKLLERLWAYHDPAAASSLHNLRQIALIRSKAKGHGGSSDARSLAAAAIEEHGSFRSHFNSICLGALEELRLIESLIET